MRYVKFVGLLMIIVCLLLGCSSDVNPDWEDVIIYGSGSISMPSDWRCFEEQGYTYIVDNNNIPMMIQSYSFAGIEDGSEGEAESNKYAENFQSIKVLTSTGLSNGATYGKMLVSCNGNNYERFYIDITVEVPMQFIVWSDSIDEKMVKNIAKSYVAEGYED